MLFLQTNLKLVGITMVGVGILSSQFYSIHPDYLGNYFW